MEIAKKDSFKWTPQWIGDPNGSKFEVTCLPTKVSVDLDEQNCTCRVWQLSGVPCMHACAAIGYRNLKPEDFVHHSLSKAKWELTYANYIQAVPSEEYWAKSNCDTIQPPPIKRPPGRPKKQRRRAPEEAIENPYRIKRKYKEIECSKCGKTGHNVRTCKGAPSESRKKKKNKACTQATNDIGVTDEQIAVVLSGDSVEAQEDLVCSGPPQASQVRFNSKCYIFMFLFSYYMCFLLYDPLYYDIYL